MYNLKTQKWLFLITSIGIGAIGLCLLLSLIPISTVLIPLAIFTSLLGWTLHGKIWPKQLLKYGSAWKAVLVSTGLFSGIIGLCLIILAIPMSLGLKMHINFQGLLQYCQGIWVSYILILYGQGSSIFLDWLMPKVTRFRRAVALSSI